MFRGKVTDVFFDLDHTLWDFDRNSGLTFRKILSDIGLEGYLADFLKIYVPINLEYWKRYRENKISKEELRYLRLKKAFDRLGLDVDDTTIGQLSVAYIEQLANYNHLLPHTREVLEYLKPMYRLHIITNGFEEVQYRKLRNAGIHSFFEQVINSEMAGVKKPHPLIFRLALEKAGTLAQRSLMVGDDLESDILGAKAVGFHTLHFNAKNEPLHNHCRMITQLGEIKRYL